MKRSASAAYRGCRAAIPLAAGTLTILAGFLLSGARAEGKGTTVPASAVASARVAALSARYRGVPYKLDCLGEACLPDKDPLFTREYADCQTLVEQVMAEAIAPHVGGLEAAIRTLRYRDQNVSIAARHHYCIPDWLTHPWPVRDVTGEVGGKQVRSITRKIDLGRLLAGRGAAGAGKLPVRTVTTAYIPRAQVRNVLSRIPDGSIIVFVLDRPGIVAGHLGFALRNEQGLTLRHASQRKMRVIDEPLSQYLGTARKAVIGVKVLQPDVRGLARSPGRSSGGGKSV